MISASNQQLTDFLSRRPHLYTNMSGHPPPGPAQAPGQGQQGHYDDGYGQHQQGNTDSYYQDDHGQPYYDNNDGYGDHHAGAHPPQQGGDGYYDES